MCLNREQNNNCNKVRLTNYKNKNSQYKGIFHITINGIVKPMNIVYEQS